MLDNGATLESCGISEKEFFVYMLQKGTKKPAPKGETESKTSNSSSAPAPTAGTSVPAPVPTPVTNAPTSTTPAPTTTTTPNPTPNTNPVSTPTVDPEQVNQLVEFGFPEDQVRAALQAANGNPDMAYEILVTGDPIVPPTPTPAPNTITGGTAPPPST